MFTSLTTILSLLKSKLGPILIGAIALLYVLHVAYSAGQNNIQVKWDKEVAQLAEEAANKKEGAGKVTTKIETVYVYIDRIVKQKGDTITKYVTQYITPAEDAKCIIPNNFILLHDAAALNTLPGDENNEIN